MRTRDDRDAELLEKAVDVDSTDGGRIMRVMAAWGGDGSRGVTGVLHFRPTPKSRVFSTV